MPRKTIETYPPFFLEDFLSDTDSGRVSRSSGSLGYDKMGICLRDPAIPERFSAEKL